MPIGWQSGYVCVKLESRGRQQFTPPVKREQGGACESSKPEELQEFEEFKEFKESRILGTCTTIRSAGSVGVHRNF